MELSGRHLLASTITMQLISATIAAWALLVEGYDGASSQWSLAAAMIALGLWIASGFIASRLIGSLWHWTILLVGPFACLSLISVAH